MKLTPNAVITISQNEEGVLKKGDPLYVGLLTHSIVDCVGVIISNQSRTIHALQHHDLNTDASCISKAITRFKLNEEGAPLIKLVINKHQLELEKNRGFDSTGKALNGYEITNRAGGTLYEIKKFLTQNNLPCEVIATSVGSDGKGGRVSNQGVFVDQDGNVDLAQTLLDPNTCGHLWDQGKDRPAVSFDLKRNAAIANLRFFAAEKSQLFTRFDGETLNPNVQPLTEKSRDYLQALYEGRLRDERVIKNKLLKDNDANIFGDDDLTKSRISINAEGKANNISSVFKERDDYLDRLQVAMGGNKLIKSENGKIVYDLNWYRQLGEPFKLELEQELGIKDNSPNPSISATHSKSIGREGFSR